jgi:NADPH:quinone reductase-like Zn-dependent oxidoreductase
MGCRVIATTSGAAKAESRERWVPMKVANYAETPDWGSTVRDLTGGEGVDLVVETVGPPTIAQSLIVAARYSEIVLLIWNAPGPPEPRDSR